MVGLTMMPASSHAAPHEPDLAGVAVDVDNGEMHAERERCRRRLEVVLCGEWLVRVSGLRCDLCPADSHTRRTRDGKRACAGIEDNVRRIGLEDIGGDRFRLLDHGLGRFPDRGAADLQRA